MAHLRKGLFILVDESRPIRDRLEFLFSTPDPFLKHMGKATATPILQVAYPDKYGVWNSISEEGLRNFGMFPEGASKGSFAHCYLAINRVLMYLAESLENRTSNFNSIPFNLNGFQQAVLC